MILFWGLRRTPENARMETPRKSQRSFKIIWKWPFRYQLNSFLNKYGPKRGRRPKAAAIFWERPKAATIFGQNRINLIPESPFSNYFEGFSTFSRGLHPSIFRGSPKSSEKYHFEYFSCFFGNRQKMSKSYFFCNLAISRFYRVSRAVRLQL